MSISQWVSDGLALGGRERAAECLMWDIGDWWNFGERYGERAQVVAGEDWTGPRHGTCREAGRVAARWHVSMRIDTLSFYHHQIVAALPDEQAIPLLRWCAEPSEPRSTLELRAEIKRLRRHDRVQLLADAAPIEGTFHVIYADPPWRFEPFSRVSGMDRAADNHYPTMSLDAIKAMPVPAADDCVLFLWATAPMLPQALDVMKAWGFAYKSNCIWVKTRPGTGYWFRNLHEQLLVGTRGDIPAPAPGEQYESVLKIAAGAHSEKPNAFAEIIEDMYPGLRLLEMFARAPRVGWECWGNEAAQQSRPAA